MTQWPVEQYQLSNICAEGEGETAKILEEVMPESFQNLIKTNIRQSRHQNKEY